MPKEIGTARREPEGRQHWRCKTAEEYTYFPLPLDCLLQFTKLLSGPLRNLLLALNGIHNYSYFSVGRLKTTHERGAVGRGKGAGLGRRLGGCRPCRSGQLC